MMPRLSIALMTGLLWAASLPCTARELNARDPVRASLVDAARHAPVSGLPADSGITLSRAWIAGARGTVCAAARRADGELLIQDGVLLIKRVELRKRGSDGASGARWDVERAERIAMSPDMTIDAACKQPSAEAVMADAVKALDDHPPAAGIKATTSPADAPCPDTVPPSDSAQITGQGVVAPAGRSRLHTTHDARCLLGKHIVQGDKVAILAQAHGWTQVRYTHPRTHVVTVGWLKSERVKPLADTDI